MADKAAMQNLHDQVTNELARAIREGETVVDKDGVAHKNPVSAAMLAQAINLLKHNGITCRAVPGNAVSNLITTLPFAGHEAVDDEGEPLRH